MGHDHHHHHHPHGTTGHGTTSHSTTSRYLGRALVFTAVFMVVEIVGGVLTRSLALLADAGHMLSDAGALAVALLAARLAERPPDERQTMGYQRAEVLGAGLNAGALVVVSIWIVVEALGRLDDPPAILAGPMLAVAAAGLVVNLVIAGQLAGHSHNINTRAALLHVLGDALGSVGAIVAGGLILWRDWRWADPAASLLIAGIVFVGALRVLREVIAVLMQAAPHHLDVPSLKRAILDLEGVTSVHNLNAWTLRPGEDVITVHIVVDPPAAAAGICEEVRSFLKASYPAAHVTVQPENAESQCC